MLIYIGPYAKGSQGVPSPGTIGHYFSSTDLPEVNTDMPEFKQAEKEVSDRITQLLSINGKRTVDDFHRELGLLVRDKCGMSRSESGLKEAIARIPEGKCAVLERGRANPWPGFMGANKGVPCGPYMTKASPQAACYFPSTPCPG